MNVPDTMALYMKTIAAIKINRTVIAMTFDQTLATQKYQNIQTCVCYFYAMAIIYLLFAKTCIFIQDIINSTKVKHYFLFAQSYHDQDH